MFAIAQEASDERFARRAARILAACRDPGGGVGSPGLTFGSRRGRGLRGEQNAGRGSRGARPDRDRLKQARPDHLARLAREIDQGRRGEREARSAADEYAKQTRDKADQDARRTDEAASAKAKRIVEPAQRRRAQIEAVIAELDARRDEALRELEHLQGELASTIEEHKPRARPHGRGGREGAEHAETKAADPVAKR